MTDAAPVLLTREDLTFGLRDLIERLSKAGRPAKIQIIGGAALSLAYYADRRSTVDIDAVGPQPPLKADAKAG